LSGRDGLITARNSQIARQPTRAQFKAGLRFRIGRRSKAALRFRADLRFRAGLKLEIKAALKVDEADTATDSAVRFGTQLD
jgi:hypothetical protein